MAYEKRSADRTALQKLKQDLRAGQPQNLYVFFGEESYLRRYYLKQLRELCGGVFPAFNVVTLNAEQVSVETLGDAVDSVPMGSERKLVVVRDYKLMQPTGDMKEYLPQLLGNLPEYVCLVFSFETLEFKPDKRLNLWKLIEEKGQVVEFAQSASDSLIPWIKSHFEAHGKAIGTKECEYLLFLCGASMDNLLTEIDKIAAGTVGGVIEQSDIDALGSRVLEATVFELTDSVAEGKQARALTILRDLFDMKQEPVAILAAVTKQFQRLYGAKLISAAGKGENEAASLLEYRSTYPAKRALQSARQFSLPRLRKAQQMCLEADVAMKSNLPDDQRTLELLLFRLAEDAR